MTQSSKIAQWNLKNYYYYFNIHLYTFVIYLIFDINILSDSEIK